MPHRLRSAPAHRLAAGAAALLLAAGLASCGGSDDDAAAGSSSPAGSTTEEAPSPAGEPTSPAPTSSSEQESEAVTVTAVDFGLELDEDSVTAGQVEFTLVNDGSSTHDLVVERDGQDVAAADAVDPGRTSTVTVTLEPGEYVLYCSIANHRAMGMETTIRVS
ncbi:cupredoxin domain-containing protein [Blastococcus litoris]|uniref:cupredoxin domain-containing protein n=1 Tax=Blastococcus litoris TaxID=2171622 RepID=UPI000E309C58|nr:cupredoxin domain-containing protein [Blastococcus litoris]